MYLVMVLEKGRKLLEMLRSISFSSDLKTGPFFNFCAISWWFFATFSFLFDFTPD